MAQADSARSIRATPPHVWLIDRETRRSVDWSRFVILDLADRFSDLSQGELGNALESVATYLCAITRKLPAHTREKGWTFEAFIILHLLRHYHKLAWPHVIEAKLSEAAQLLVTGTEYCEGHMPVGYSS